MRIFRIHLLCCIAVTSILPCAIAMAQTQPATPEPFRFGFDGFTIPPSIVLPSTPPRTVELLTQALAANPVVPRRVELVHDLGECRMPTALTAVIAAMSDPDAAVRSEAARAAGVLGDKAALPQLQKLLADSIAAVRIEAIRAGTALHDPSFASAGLADADESCFVSACGLASTAEHDAQIAARLPSVSVASRRIAIRALARRGASAQAPAVTSQLGSSDVSLLIDSIDALASMNADSEVANVKKFLTYDHPSVRRASVHAMSLLAGADDQIAVARQMLGDPDLSVRQAAADLLVVHPATDIVPLLMQQLSAGYRPLTLSARNALTAAASLAAQPVTEAAAKLLDDPDPFRRADGSFILGELKSDLALEKHISLLGDPDWALVQQAANSLGRIGRAEAGAQLAKIISRASQNEESKGREPGELEAIGTAFIACGRLHYKAALPLAKQLTPQKLTCSPVIRSRAIWAAGVLGEAEDRELAGMLLNVANDNSPFEVEEARFEAIKAIGNLQHKPALDEMRRQAREDLQPSLRWMAHLVADRLAGGASTPYTPPTVAVIAETSIQDLGK